MKKHAKVERVEINIGWACNNNCLFCVETENRKESIKKKFFVKSVSKIKKDLERSIKQGANHVTFLGGEPTIQKNFAELVRYAKSLGYKTIFITTNGRRCSDISYLKGIINAGVNGFCVSIHAPNAELHNALTRTPKSFEQTTEGIKNLSKLKQPFMTSTVINKLNYKLLPGLARFLIRFKPVKIMYSFIQPSGITYKPFDHIVPLMKEVIPYIKQSIVLCKKAKVPISVYGIPLCLMKGLEDHSDELYRNLRKIITHPGKPSLQTLNTGKWRQKGEHCLDCKYNLLCGWVLIHYIEKFGFNEFSPVNGEVLDSSVLK